MEGGNNVPVAAVKPLQAANTGDLVIKIHRNPHGITLTTNENSDSRQRFPRRRNRGSGKKEFKRSQMGETGSSSSSGSSGRNTTKNYYPRKSNGVKKQKQKPKAPVYCPSCGHANERTSDTCGDCQIKFWELLHNVCHPCLKDLFDGQRFCHRCRWVATQNMDIEEHQSEGEQFKIPTPPPPKN